MVSTNKQKGMTIVELVVVVIIIIILWIISIPAFHALQNNTRDKEFKKTVSLVQDHIKSWHERLLLVVKVDSYPEVLDGNPVQSVCKSCFESVLNKGISNDLWYKVSKTEYYFSRNGNTGELANYKDKKDYRVTYNPSNGILKTHAVQ